MNQDKAIINFNIECKGKIETKDLEIPIDITVNELIIALNSAYNLGIDLENKKQCYLKAENPIALLKGNKTLRNYKIMNGTSITFNKGEYNE